MYVYIIAPYVSYSFLLLPLSTLRKMRGGGEDGTEGRVQPGEAEATLRGRRTSFQVFSKSKIQKPKTRQAAQLEGNVRTLEI